MPSPVPVVYRGPVVRQLSLQNQTPLQSPGGHILKKQLSEDNSRTFDGVEVTGQRWTAVERPESILRVGSADNGKILQGGKFGTRPKPVKVAWADSKQCSIECSTDVEIVATKCPGQARPLSMKTQRFRKPLLGNKDTLVYTRLQLAERLRNAWSEREKVKPNLNIFLAQPTDTARSDNISSVRQEDNASALSDPSASDRKRKAIQSKGENDFLQSHCPPLEIFQPRLHLSLYESKLQLDYFHAEEEITKKLDSSCSGEEKNTIKERHCIQELKRVEIKIVKNEQLQNNDSSEPLLGGEKKENLTSEQSCEVCQDEKAKKKAQQNIKVSAQERRANFRRSGILHKTLTESFSQCEDKGEHTDEVKKFIPRKPPLIRALSAPCQKQLFPKQKIVKPQLQRKSQPNSSFDSTCLPVDNITEMRERIKSAPIRRKLKTAAMRRKNKDKPNSSSEDEKETKEPSKTTKKIAKRTIVPKGAEIITMVSLVSPAESDTEDSVITLPVESLPLQEEKVETSPSNTSKDAEQKVSSPFDVQKFVSLRKKTKTVSFQTHPALSKSYCSSFPSRRTPAGTPIIVPTPVYSNPALTPAQLHERDKRPPFFPGSDGRGIKRRLLRTTSEPAKEEEEVNEDEKSFNIQRAFGEDNESSKKSNDDDYCEGECDDGENSALKQLEFKYPREKECWTLYQKMVSKGISVSYDTILRGMLTPTEYRLRKDRLLPIC